MVKLAIEHLEPYLSRWLWLEYRHASKLARGKLEFTNVKREDHRRALSKLAPAHPESILELYPLSRLVILDPLAPLQLAPEDLRGEVVVVVGGILGDHPPKGRTRKLLTSRAEGAMARSLGRHQFSIDGSVYVALKVAEGARLEEIPVKVGVTVRASSILIHLPYAYPLRKGRPVISRELVEYLRSSIVEDEERLLRGEEPREVTMEEV